MSEIQDVTFEKDTTRHFLVDLDQVGIATVGITDEDSDREIDCLMVVVKDPKANDGITNILLLNDNEAVELAVMLLKLVREFRGDSE